MIGSMVAAKFDHATSRNGTIPKTKAVPLPPFAKGGKGGFCPPELTKSPSIPLY